MIICFEGTPGSGKTYDSVKKIIDNLKIGRTVYTNVDGLTESKCKEHIKLLTKLDDYDLSRKLIFLSPAEVQNFWVKAKHGSLIVIDEVHKFFSNREWQSKSNKEFGNWASTHRHFGYDVVLITQNIEKIDSHVRTLVEWTYRYKKINFFGSAIKNRYVCYAYSGCDSDKNYLQKDIKSYNKRIFACYSSYVSQDVKELGFMTHANVLKHPVFYAIPVMIVIFLVFFMKSGFSKGYIIPGSEKVMSMSSKVPLGVDNVVAGGIKGQIVVEEKKSKDVKDYLSIVEAKSKGNTEGVVELNKTVYKILGYVSVPKIDSEIPNDVDSNNSYFLYEDYKGIVKKIKAFNLDSICKCNSIASIVPGTYEF